MAQFNRERVPERVVHAKGSGAFGYFEVTRDASQWTKAAFLNQVGKRTPVLLRFSTVAGEQGSADTARDPRGFALKFYTEEGNYDLVGNNTPIFFLRDPSRFSDFIHSQKRLPDTGLRDNTMQWDFWSLSPEAMHQVTFLMSDRGALRTWRHMNGYGSHTFLWVNARVERSWVKYHFKTEQGIDNFTDAEAKAMSAEDPDFHIRIAIASAPTTRNCRSIDRYRRCTATARTAPWSTSIAEASRCTRRTASGDRRPIPGAAAMPGGRWTPATCCARHTRCGPRTTISARPAHCIARSCPRPTRITWLPTSADTCAG